MKYYVSDDELIKMIAKENEEALRLLFLRYENKIRYLYYGNEKYMRGHGIEEGDLLLNVYQLIENIVVRYDPNQSLFSTYFNGAYQKMVSKMIKKSEMMMENIAFDYEFEEETCVDFSSQLSDSIQKASNDFDINFVLESLENEKELTRKIIKLWLQGYSYEEVAYMCNVNKKKVNNVITAFIKKMRKYYNLL